MGDVFANFTHHARGFGSQPAWQRGRRIQTAADIGIDVVNANGFILDLDFVFRRVPRGELNRFEYVRAAMLLKLNAYCHVSSAVISFGRGWPVG